MPLDRIMEGWVPGSQDQPWSWADETHDILSRECLCCGEPGHYQLSLEAHMEQEGEFWSEIGMPILGSDGRVWDGHHRIIGAVRIGWEGLTVEHMAETTMTVEEIQALAAFAAQECEWQMSGEKSVARYINAYFYLHHNRDITVDNILVLGYLVEPSKNSTEHFRRVGVRVGMSVKLHWESVPEAMYRLIEYGVDADPTEWFRQFEEIHPFVDGNGRVGALLWNLMAGHYEPLELEFPPNLWDDHRREGASTHG